jgi:hypothetical protein
MPAVEVGLQRGRVLEQNVNTSDKLSEADKFDAATVYHALLRIAHHVQHPVQEQGRPVPNQRSGQAERLRSFLLGNDAFAASTAPGSTVKA